MFGIEKDFQKLMEQVYGHLNKDKMTDKQTPSDIIEIGGVKYKRIEEPQSFYDKLWELLKTKLGDSVDCDEMSDRVVDLIREHIPEPKKGMGLPEYCVGFNDCIERIEENLQLDT